MAHSFGVLTGIFSDLIQLLFIDMPTMCVYIYIYIFINMRAFLNMLDRLLFCLALKWTLNHGSHPLQCSERF